MKRMNLRKTLIAAALIGGTIVAASALADPSQGGYGSGCGMGPGMMGGYGQGSSYGMGPGMMGGYGQGSSYRMGPEMMRGYGPRSNLNLSAEQRGEIARIQNEVRRKHWDLMGMMQDEQSLMNEQYSSDKRDDDGLSKSYRKMSEFRHQMFDLSLSARKQIDAVSSRSSTRSSEKANR